MYINLSRRDDVQWEKIDVQIDRNDLAQERVLYFKVLIEFITLR